MKRIVILSMLVFMTGTTFSQLTLDATYNGATSSGKHFLYIQLDSADYKYVVMDPLNSQFTLYNLNHSVYLNVTVPISYVGGSTQYTISYISRSLVDCDTSNIEYILSMVGDGIPNSYPKQTLIYSTNGTLLQTIDSCVFINYSDGWKYGPEYNKPIVNTPNGTKLLLRHLNGDAKVYNLCGELYQSIDEVNEDFGLSPAFPNPTSDYITIPYSFPDNISKGQIMLYDISGKLIKTYKVDRTFTELIISTEQLSSGTYYYNLQTDTEVIKGNKIIKIDK